MFDKILLILIVLITFYSCSKGEKDTNTSEKAEVIDIANLEWVEAENYSEIISDYKLIPLETTDESLIGNIEYVLFTKDEIFVQDQITQTIFIFDASGKYLNKISKRGEGPEEYNGLSSFAIDELNERIIVSASGKFIVYDFDGEYLKSFNTILGGAKQIAYLGDNLIAIYLNYLQLEEHQEFHNLLIFDIENEKHVDKFLPYNPNIRVENMTSFYNDFSTQDNLKNYLSIPYNDEVWEISNGFVSTKYYIDFGSHSMPDNFHDEYLTDPKYTSSQIRGIISDNSWYSIRGGGVSVTDKFVSFSYADKDDFISVLYDKENHRGYRFNGLTNDLDGTKFIIHRSVRDGYFVTILPPSSLMSAVEKGIDLNQEAQKVLRQGLQEDDNPILRLVNYEFEK